MVDRLAKGTCRGKGRSSARGPSLFDDFRPGHGFSEVDDNATGSTPAFSSGLAGVVPRRGGHAIVNLWLSDAIESSGGQRAGSTAIFKSSGSPEVQWLSRSVKDAATLCVSAPMRPAIPDAPTAVTGRVLVG